MPISQPIQDIIVNISWDMAYKCKAACYNNHYLLAVPMESNELDTILVHHYLTGGWAIFTGWDVSCFYEQPYQGASRFLIGLRNGDVVEWRDYIPELQDAPSDFQDKGVDVPTELITKAFICKEPLIQSLVSTGSWMSSPRIAPFPSMRSAMTKTRSWFAPTRLMPAT